MNISAVNNNAQAFTARADKNKESKKPSKLKVAAGVATVAGAAVLAAGLASGKVKPADITNVLQKAGKSALNAVKHPVATVKSLPNKLWGMTLNGVGKGTELFLNAKDFVTGGVKKVSDYAGILKETFTEVFGRKN